MKRSHAFYVAGVLAAALMAGVCAPFTGLVAAAKADASSAASSGSTSCAITTDDLATIQTAAEQGLLSELSARRALLTRVIACAMGDAQSLQDELNSLQGVPSNAQYIRSQLSGKLGDALTYYQLENAKVGSAGVAGTQQIAREVLNWRASNYEPLAENVQVFELWVSSQSLFAAGETRLTGITSLISFLTQTVGQDVTLQSDLSSAQSLMQSALNANQDARTALAESLPAGQVRARIQQSLQALSDAYQEFFTIAGRVQTLVTGNSSSSAASAGQ